MAIEAQTISTQEIKPLFSRGTSNSQALGTAHEDAHTFYDMGLNSFTMPYDSSALEVAPNLSGHSGQIESQGRHRRDLNTYTFDVSFKGTVVGILQNCLWAFGDAASAAELTPAIGIGNGAAGDMQMKHGAASKNHCTVIFRNGGTDATADDLVVRGAMIQSMTLSEGVDANSGQLTIDSTFWTPYPPTEEANTVSSNITVDAGNAPKSIFALNTNSTASAIQLGGQELMPLSWEITISRGLERVGSQDYSSFLPYAVVQTGAWEVTGSVTVKADDNTYDIVAKMQGDSAGINLSIDESSGFAIDCPDVMIDAANIDTGGNFLTHTIPFRAFAASSTANIISITAS
tara:strand:- start:2261 stop:3298 length:1038 start_codon:yes stop_codon:yes gene_type:complete